MTHSDHIHLHPNHLEGREGVMGRCRQPVSSLLTLVFNSHVNPRPPSHSLPSPDPNPNPSHPHCVPPASILKPKSPICSSTLSHWKLLTSFNLKRGTSCVCCFSQINGRWTQARLTRHTNQSGLPGQCLIVRKDLTLSAIQCCSLLPSVGWYERI